MRIEFLPEADEEFREAARYYESEAPGVGLAFTAEVHRTLSTLSVHPRSNRLVTVTIRRKVLSHFPYSIFYSIETDCLLVVAVAHQKRRPRYWKRRQQQRQ